MNIKLLFLISILTFSYTKTSAQTDISTEKKNQFEFSIGHNSGFLKNLAFAPVSRYGYNGLNHRFKYVRTSKKENLFEGQLDYFNSELKSELIPVLNAGYSKIILNFSYLKRVYNRNRFTIQVGLQTQTNKYSYFQGGILDFEPTTYDFQQKFGIASRFTFHIDEKQSLSSKLTIPIVMWRTSTFEENLYSLNSYQSVLWTTEYKYELTKHFDVKVNYGFNYDKLQISNAYRELQYQINLGISYKF